MACSVQQLVMYHAVGLLERHCVGHNAKQLVTAYILAAATPQTTAHM